MSDIAQPIPRPLEYATRTTVGMDAVTLAHFRQYAFRALMLAILSGLCVGVCFLPLAFQHNVLASGVHALVFFATLVMGYRTGGALIATLQAFGEPQAYRTALIFDIVAGVGLGLLAVAPFIYSFMPADEHMVISIYLAVAYACFAASVPRHRIHYRTVAMLMAAHGSVYVGGMRVLGWVKMIYEGVWLALCTITLLCIVVGGRSTPDVTIIFALGALFGCMGYAGIWVWMIVRHAMLHRRLRTSS